MHVDAGRETVLWGTITWSEIAAKINKLKRSVTVASRNKGRHPMRQSDQNTCNRLLARENARGYVTNQTNSPRSIY